MVLDSMYLSALAAEMVEPNNTMFTGLDANGSSYLISVFVSPFACPQSMEERCMLLKDLSHPVRLSDSAPSVSRAGRGAKGRVSSSDWI